MTKLSPNFSLDEATKSNTAIAHGIKNTPTPQHLENLKWSANCMELVRARLGDRSIIAVSVYRNPEVNELVGGTPTSSHPMGHAWDFHHATLTDYEVAKRIASTPEIMQWVDQLILEGTAKKPRCVHISFDPRRRGQVRSQPGRAGTKLYPGLEKWK